MALIHMGGLFAAVAAFAYLLVLFASKR